MDTLIQSTRRQISSSPFQSVLSSIRKEVWLHSMVPSFLAADDFRSLRCLCRVSREMNSMTSCRATLERLKEWSADTTPLESSLQNFSSKRFELNELPNGNDCKEFAPEDLQKTRCEGRSLGLELSDLFVYARGKHSIIYKGRLKGTTVGIKQNRNLDHAAAKEALMLKEVNTLGIGPKLLASSPTALVYKWVQGVPILDYFASVDCSNLIVECIKEVLHQCFVLDQAGINKNEMTHPERHILVSCNGVKMIDFERGSWTTSKPKNVTQVCQFFCSPQVISKLLVKRIKVDIKNIRICAKQYKMSPSLSTVNAIICAAFSMTGAENEPTVL